MVKISSKKVLILTIILSLLLSSIIPTIMADKNFFFYKTGYSYSYDQLDLQYIYNLTENLSNIIFTEYDEENGEIEKGRAYGTVGEQKAAEILFENMTSLGLSTYLEQINNTEDYPDLTHELEIVEYSFKINDKEADSYIAPVWFETSENNYDLNHTYEYTDLKVIKPPVSPSLYIQTQKILGKLEPFVVIIEDRAFYPYNPFRNIPFFDSLYFQYYIVGRIQGAIPILYSNLWAKHLDYCKGLILSDFNNDVEVHDMNLLKHQNRIPFIYINNSDGEKIRQNIDDTRISFKLKQNLNTSVISSNVIGQLNGTNPNQIVIVSSLYDSWWCQGTADSAIGMSMVLAIAKYFKENEIEPEYTIKFIGFSGEEHGFCAGAKHYASSHENETIKYIIDLNQLGFKQDDPKLTLNIMGNKLGLLFNIFTQITRKANYENRVNSSKALKFVLLKKDIVSNPMPFTDTHPDCEILCFLKDSGWKLHHRDGLNHSEGDVLKYFDPEDVNVTGEIVLNVVKYLTTDWS